MSTNINKTIESGLITTFKKIDDFFDWIIKYMPTIAKVTIIIVIILAVIISLQKFASSDDLTEGSGIPKF